MNRIFIWTDGDLDGAGCLLSLKWLFEREGVIVHNKVASNGTDLTKTFGEWFTNNSEYYDKVFICDISLSEEAIGIVDSEKVIVIDHHKSHGEIKHLYTKALAVIYEHTSTVDIIRKKFKLESRLEKEELDFLTYVDDYDCYRLKHPESMKLNIILKQRRFDNFVQDFKDGFREFTQIENNIISLFFKELRHQLNTTEYFTGKLGPYTVVACYVERYSSETAHITLKKYNADICMCINLKYCSVSLRKKRGCPVKLNVIAEKLCDGGGHEYAAAGKLTDKFANLIKDFKPC